MPEPEYMAVAGPSEPWVLDLRDRVEKALNAAIVPLRVRKTRGMYQGHNEEGKGGEGVLIFKHGRSRKR